MSSPRSTGAACRLLQERAITFATVSKVLRVLENDLIVGREGSSLRLLQADKLLEASMNYMPPKNGRDHQLEYSTGEKRCSVGHGGFEPGLSKPRLPPVGDRTSSVSMYAVMQREDTISIYCPDPESWLANVPGSRTDRFPAIAVIRTDDASVYFDRAERIGSCMGLAGANGAR